MESHEADKAADAKSTEGRDEPAAMTSEERIAMLMAVSTTTLDDSGERSVNLTTDKQTETLQSEYGRAEETHSVELGETAESDATKITGHSWERHRDEFPGWTENQFHKAVERTMENPSQMKNMARGRTAYWNESDEMVVIHNASVPYRGTAFRPLNGKAYFDMLE